MLVVATCIIRLVFPEQEDFMEDITGTVGEKARIKEAFAQKRNIAQEALCWRKGVLYEIGVEALEDGPDDHVFLVPVEGAPRFGKGLRRKDLTISRGIAGPERIQPMKEVCVPDCMWTPWW